MQQRGFTLIELIIVIVILGILAVTAAPRFIDLQADATESTLQGVKAALQGGGQLIYAKSAIDGEQDLDSDAGPIVDLNRDGDTVGDDNITTHFGYPDADTADEDNILLWADLDPADWTFTGDITVGSNDAFRISPADYTAPATGSACHVEYENAIDATSSPKITVVSSDC